MKTGVQPDSNSVVVEFPAPSIDSPADMLHHLVRVLGGPAVVGRLLRGDELDARAACRWVKRCLARAQADTRQDGCPKRGPFFHPHHVIKMLRLAADKGDHAPMKYWANAIGYQVAPVERIQTVAALLKEYRGKITSETDCVIEAIKRVSGRDRSEIVREILHKWAVEKIHEVGALGRALEHNETGKPANWPADPEVEA